MYAYVRLRRDYIPRNIITAILLHMLPARTYAYGKTVVGHKNSIPIGFSIENN